MVVIGIAVAAVAVFALIAAVPVSHAFSFAIFCTPVTQEYHSGVAVRFSWISHTGSTAELRVTHLVNYSPGGQGVIYDTWAMNGSFSFTAQGGEYIYSSLGGCPDVYGAGPPFPVNVSGDWSAPLL